MDTVPSGAITPVVTIWPPDMTACSMATGMPSRTARFSCCGTKRSFSSRRRPSMGERSRHTHDDRHDHLRQRRTSAAPATPKLAPGNVNPPTWRVGEDEQQVEHHIQPAHQHQQGAGCPHITAGLQQRGHQTVYLQGGEGQGRRSGNTRTHLARCSPPHPASGGDCRTRRCPPAPVSVRRPLPPAGSASPDCGHPASSPRRCAGPSERRNPPSAHGTGPSRSHVLDATNPMAALASRPRCPTMDESIYCIAMDAQLRQNGGDTQLQCHRCLLPQCQLFAVPQRRQQVFFTYPLLSSHRPTTIPAVSQKVNCKICRRR